MSKDKERVILTHYPRCTRAVYLTSNMWEAIPAISLYPDYSLRKDEYYDIVALGINLNHQDAITPHLKFYSPSQVQPITEVVPLRSDFASYLGQYLGFTFDKYSITYFGNKSIVRLDYRISIEISGVYNTGYSSRYIPLNVLDDIEDTL
jgi:hypothetical protein